MTTIDLTPLYRSSIGFDRLASLLEGAFRADQVNASYPPYNIEVIDDNCYALTLAVAGFSHDEVDIYVEGGVLNIKGKKKEDTEKRNYLHQGIATRAFERKFNLADHVEVTGAKLENGLLSVQLKHELPEAMKPKRIQIETGSKVLEHQPASEKAA